VRLCRNFYLLCYPHRAASRLYTVTAGPTAIIPLLVSYAQSVIILIALRLDISAFPLVQDDEDNAKG
jgi:hypothetical protein